MVSLGRFELPAPGLGILCSIHLSYRDTDYYNNDIFTILSINSSKDIPASFADMGSRLVSVMPGDVFNSNT
jgi:hypothetical protein